MRRLLLVLLLLAAVVVVARSASCEVLELQPECYVALRPGPTEDAASLIEIGDEESYSSPGQLLLTTVAVEEDLSLRDWARASLSGSVDTIPRAAIFPPETDRDEATRQHTAMMDDSQLTATVAALRQAGYEVDETLDGAGVQEGAPQLELPVDVTIDAGAIGGPSAGLMFALSIVDLLEPDDLTGGAVMAGTGTLDTEGVVGAVGGVRQKVVAAADPGHGERPASVFLVPRSNQAQVEELTVARDLLLVPVDTLEDALEAIVDVREGRDPAGALALQGQPD